MKSKVPFTLLATDSIPLGSIVIVLRNDERHPAIVSSGSDGKRYLFMLAGPLSGQFRALNEDQYLMLTADAYLKAPLQVSQYQKNLTVSAPFYYVINDTSEYFAYHFNGGFELHGVDCRTGVSGPVAGQPYFISGWKIVVDDYDGVIAEG
jgi:hypothetical protein